MYNSNFCVNYSYWTFRKILRPTMILMPAFPTNSNLMDGKLKCLGSSCGMPRASFGATFMKMVRFSKDYMQKINCVLNILTKKNHWEPQGHNSKIFYQNIFLLRTGYLPCLNNEDYWCISLPFVTRSAYFS